MTELQGGVMYPNYGTYDDFSKIGTKNTHPPFSQTDSQKSTLVLFEIRPKHPTPYFWIKKYRRYFSKFWTKIDHPPSIFIFFTPQSPFLYIKKENIMQNPYFVVKKYHKYILNEINHTCPKC